MLRAMCFVLALSFLSAVEGGEVNDRELDLDFYPALRKKIQESDSNSTHIEDATLALAVEWIRMRDLVSEGRIGRKGDTFLGFVAGRVGVRPPDWWSKEVRCGIVQSDGRVGMRSRHPKILWKGDKEGWQFSGINNVAESTDGLVLEQGSKKVILPKVAFGELETGTGWNSKEDGAIAAVIQNDICCAVFQCGTEGPDDPDLLYCVNSQTHRVLWKQELRQGMLPIQGGTGATWNYTQVTIDGERVAVWTGHGIAVVVEVFNAKDGKPIAMFSSNYLTGVHTRD